MRWFILCIAAGLACAQTFDVTPRKIPQGQTLKLHSTVDAASVRVNGRTIRLFAQADGGWLGLMPVPALEKPGEYKLELLDKNGAVAQTTSITVVDAHFPSQNIVISKSLSELKASPDEAEITSAFRKEVIDTRYWAEPFMAPVPGCMTSLYGVRRLHNGKPTGDYHGGLDLRAAAGQPIRATTAGVVKIAKQFNLHGGTVAIDHGQGLQSMYLHMSKIAATEGATVQKGEVIGYAGSTGRSTGPHLHWSLYVNGLPVNPLQWVEVRSCSQTGPHRVKPVPPPHHP
jgi:murein DD-endopeptidase MepM/ murein hydrolase activator NlpD